MARKFFAVSVDADELEGQGIDPTESCDFTTLDPMAFEVEQVDFEAGLDTVVIDKLMEG